GHPAEPKRGSRHSPCMPVFILRHAAADGSEEARMPTGDEYRRLAADLSERAKREPDSLTRAEFQNLAVSYLRLAAQADKNSKVDGFDDRRAGSGGSTALGAFRSLRQVRWLHRQIHVPSIFWGCVIYRADVARGGRGETSPRVSNPRHPVAERRDSAPNPESRR